MNYYLESKASSKNSNIMIKNITSGLIFIFLSATCHANPITVVLYGTDNAQTSLGTLDFNDTPYGLLITPHLSQLPPGVHGFHLHEHPDCKAHGMAAGSHFDPEKTGTHLGPYATGHLGDLPALFVGVDGTANTPLLAPKLTTKQLQGLTVMLHAGGDNYSDTPALGGGGARMACGIIK